ncbi:hypothetical protein GCM10009554_28790 [Kribbella koreensis]|uniref:Uncharacterized protein n=2 Tax=Kribbella TaxID=182639 RepID=A0ABP6YNZ3_9ACTN
MRNRSQLVRRVVAVVGGLGLAAGAVGVAGALQANASTTGQNTVAAQPVVAKKITIATNGTYVPLWAKVTLSGKTTGIKANSVVQVQRLEGTKWVNFPATTKVTSKATYAVKVASGRAGVNKFRVVSSSTISPVVSITFAK